MEVLVIDGVEPDPSVKTCKEGGAKMAAFNPDWIIALGGGSAMDAAKIMWVYYEYPGYNFDDLAAFKFPKLRTKAKLVGIPSRLPKLPLFPLLRTPKKISNTRS